MEVFEEAIRGTRLDDEDEDITLVMHEVAMFFEGMIL